MNCLIKIGSFATRVVILPGTSVLIIHPCKPNVREVNSLVPPRVGSFFEAFFFSIHCYFFCKWQLIWPLNPDPFNLIFCHCTLNFSVSFNLILTYLAYEDFPRAWAVLLPAEKVTSSDEHLWATQE